MTVYYGRLCKVIRCTTVNSAGWSDSKTNNCRPLVVHSLIYAFQGDDCLHFPL